MVSSHNKQNRQRNTPWWPCPASGAWTPGTSDHGDWDGASCASHISGELCWHQSWQPLGHPRAQTRNWIIPGVGRHQTQTGDCSDVSRVRDPPRVNYGMLDQSSELGWRLVMSNLRQLTQTQGWVTPGLVSPQGSISEWEQKSKWVS